MYEIALTRIFSVTMWYHFAFVAISVALFGMTVGALLVYLLPRWFRDRRRQAAALASSSLLFGVALAVCFVTQLAIPFSPRAHARRRWSIVVTCVVISIPFVFSGIVVCLALTRFPRRVNRLYAADLIGAALGCVLLVVLFTGSTGRAWSSWSARSQRVGALVFALDAGSRRGMAVAARGRRSCSAASARSTATCTRRGDPLLRIIWAKEADPKHEYEKWNAFSRVTVDGDRDATSRGRGSG